ncbi:MAG: error-prone DNA polymerase, partial [Betaproteobacteria bacterium]|nr:error-prone DNA polymerase [Betaproteobacteria bacterium]
GAADALIDARTAQLFESVEDMAARAGLDAHSLQVLAAADSLHTLAGHRHQASWQALGTETRRSALMRPARIVEDAVELSAPSAGETVVADYASLGFSLKHHPVALLRKRLQAMGFADAASLRGYPAQRLARACGIVTHRQRPETAKGTVFVTLEDETGPVNIIVWSSLVERQRKELLGAQLLGVYGVWQREGQVMHLLAKRLVDLSALLGGLLSRSRDFH